VRRRHKLARKQPIRDGLIATPPKKRIGRGTGPAAASSAPPIPRRQGTMRRQMRISMFKSDGKRSSEHLPGISREASCRSNSVLPTTFRDMKSNEESLPAAFNSGA
jgi:hypothetical protein